MSQSVLWQQREAIHLISGLNILYLVLIQDIHDCFIMLLSWFFKSIAASPYSSHMAWQTSMERFASPRKLSSLSHGIKRNISAYICLWISLWFCVSRTRVSSCKAVCAHPKVWCAKVDACRWEEHFYSCRTQGYTLFRSGKVLHPCIALAHLVWQGDTLSGFAQLSTGLWMEALNKRVNVFFL